MEYLSNKQFLKKLCSYRFKETFARITLLSLDGLPIEQIEGKVTSGTVNIDGSSAVRRSCSLSLITTKQDITDYYWSLKSKFKLELGLTNITDEYLEYPIIWIPLGEFLIASFSLSMNTTQTTVNINGKDKMCQLNGEMGGVLAAPTDFGQIEEYDFSGNRVINKLPIKQIIRDMIHTYADESYSRIIIDDIDDYGLLLETYRSNSPLYLFFTSLDKTRAVSFTFDENFKVYKKINSKEVEITIGSIPNEEFLNGSMIETNLQYFTTKKGSDRQFLIRKITYGQTVGYKLTDLTYPGDLIANAGETIISVLDKIKKMLGSDFEYYYDIDGCFYFKRQEAYLSTNKGLTGATSSVIIAPTTEPIDFSFDNLDLIISINNNPAIQNVKNDFTVWGARKAAGGGSSTVPIHMRYAIDEKPTTYTTIGIDANRAKTLLSQYSEYFQLREGETEEFAIRRLMAAHPQKTFTTKDYDYRELIYQMAKDYRAFNQIDEFPLWLQENNQWCINGKTGYERYYIDIEGFWRDLYQKTTNTKKYYDRFVENQEYFLDLSDNKEAIKTAKVKYNTRNIYIPSSSGLLNQKVKDYELYLEQEETVEKQLTKDNIKNQKKIELQKWFEHKEEPYFCDLFEDEIFKDENGKALKTLFDNQGKCILESADVQAKLDYVNAEIVNINKADYKQESDRQIDLEARYISVNYFTVGLKLFQDYENYLDNENSSGYNSRYLKLGSLYDIINTNYNILKCRVQRVFLDMVYDLAVGKDAAKKRNADQWLSRIETAFPKIVQDTTLYLKDSRKRIKNANTKEWEPPEESNQYIGFSYAYARSADFTRIDTNGKSYHDISAILIATDNAAKIEGFSDTDQTILREIYHLTPSEVKKSTLFEQYGADYGQIFLDFYLNYPTGYNKLGKYYDLTSLSEKIYIREEEEYKKFEDVLNIARFEPNTEGKITLAELLNYNHMVFNKVFSIDSPDKNNLYNLFFDENGNENLNLDYNQILYIASMLSIGYNDLIQYYPIGYTASGWNENVLYNPEVLNFWFDLLDTSSQLSKYSVKNIGPREKVTNNNNVKAIKYLETPNNIFIDPTDKVFQSNKKLKEYFSSSQKKTGYTYFNLGSNFSNYLSVSSQGTDAFTIIENQLYNFAQCAESISITCIPQYFLRPNTKIEVYNPELQINGTYILNKITIPLAYNGTMSLTATKALEEIITREEISTS